MTTQRRSLRHDDGGEATTPTLLDHQHALPRTIPLFRYIPRRAGFSWRSWDHTRVRSANDLPQYLILGDLDPSTVAISDGGWSARWQGTEHDTHFDVAYKVGENRWEVRQRWCGLDGGFSIYSTRVPLDRVIGQALNMTFPPNWDRAAKERFEADYQLTFVERPEDAAGFFGIPDGALHSIAFPVAARDLRAVRQWLHEKVTRSAPTYPVAVVARLVFQAINYVEGKAPPWTSEEVITFRQSILDTGLAPCGAPVRETADDGAAAWTLRRDVYFVFVTLPFAGLTDFLSRMATEDVAIRRSGSHPDLRFELRPVVMPAAWERLAESVECWDSAKTTRVFLRFAPLGDEKKVATIEPFIEDERNTADALDRIEAISGEVVSTFDEICERAIAEASS